MVELGFGELPDGTSAGVDATSEVVLRDNDTSALALSYGAGTLTAVEGSIAVAVVVHLSQAAQSDLAVPVTVTPRGTTAAGDYAVSGLAEDGTLAFAEGARSRTLMVTAVEDADAANEAVVLGFGGGVVPAGDPAVAVISLQDNDTTALNVQFGAASYTAVERGAAAAVTVSLNQPAPRGLAIPVTVSLRGTTQTGDYTVAGLDTAGTLAFAAGERSKTVTVTANDDADAATEQVVLGFGGVVPPGAVAVTVVSLQEAAAGGGTRAGARARADRPQVSFVATEYEIAEGTSAVVTVRLSAPLEESVAVPITAQPRGATQADDYTREGLTDGALAFDAGAVEQTFTVRAKPRCGRPARDGGAGVRNAAGQRDRGPSGDRHRTDRGRRSAGHGAHHAREPGAGAAPGAGGDGEHDRRHRWPCRSGVGRRAPAMPRSTPRGWSGCPRRWQRATVRARSAARRSCRASSRCSGTRHSRCR